MPPTVSTITTTARRRMGFELSDLQRAAIESILSGRDTLVVSPTGSGKSAIYQLAGEALPGATVVVSPLLALQHDQVAAMQEAGLRDIVVVNSLNGSQRAADLRRVADGRAEFIVLGPEQFRRADVLEALRGTRLDRLVVDEAHCVDSWGPDFRPDFLRLGGVRAELGQPPVLALTATAAPHVQAQITQVLGMADPSVITAAPERPNIHLSVVSHADKPTTREAIVADAAGRVGCGLVYVPTRRDAEELAATITAAGRGDAMAYHGSLRADQRQHVHEAFRSGGDVVVVATSAFGLGVDAPHVRFVLHLDAPETVDAYYQEIGRAGRDGEWAQAVLHVTTGHASRRRFAAAHSIPDLELCEALVLGGARSAEQAGKELGQALGRVLQAAVLLQQHGLVSFGSKLVLRPRRSRWPARRPKVAAALEQRAALLTSRRQMIDRLIVSGECRWATVSGYLGVPSIDQCGHCDICDAASAPRQENNRRVVVEHKTFGRGEVMDEGAHDIVVLFDAAGYRTLSRSVIAEEGLIRVVDAHRR